MIKETRSTYRLGANTLGDLAAKLLNIVEEDGDHTITGIDFEQDYLGGLSMQPVASSRVTVEVIDNEEETP